MSKITNPTLVPELRFPEFTGKWNKEELGQLSKILRGGSPRPIDDFLTKDKSALNWLKIGDVDKDAKYISMTQERVKVEALSKTRVVNSGDLIMSNSMSFGRPYIMKIQSCIHDGWIAVTDVSQSIDVNYLYYLILSDASQRYFLNSAAGGGIKNLNADIIKKTPVFYAENINEQKKIADCLSSMDDLITKSIKKLESLKSHKKGLMQRLFPAEGKCVPELRFPEFTGKWNEIELGQLSTILRGGSPRPIDNFLTKDKKALNWLKIGDVDKDAKYISMTQERVKAEALSKTRVVNSGDLIMSNSMSFGRPYIMKIQSCIHDGWIAVTDVSQSIDVNYLYYFILSDASQSYFVNSAAGGGIKNLNADIIKKTPVFYAEDIKEQKKIADTLSSIDDLITENIKNLESLKSHKKGLMQKLFPGMKEPIA